MIIGQSTDMMQYRSKYPEQLANKKLHSEPRDRNSMCTNW